MTDNIQQLIEKASTLIDRLLEIVPVQAKIDWNAIAWRYHHGTFEAVSYPDPIALTDLMAISNQKATLVQNTLQFIQKLPCNNVLLTGARGTGKSSLVKALLNSYQHQGLRLIEVDKTDLEDLPQIQSSLRERPERFIIFCDDLSFETGDLGYKALKVALDGGIDAKSSNVLIYATSNRRHLMPQLMQENLETYSEQGEIRPGDTIDEKVSLSERFGLWISFYAFDQDEYLEIASYWLQYFNISPVTKTHHQAALSFALNRGARSGRVAYQFACDYVGRLGLKGQSLS